MFVFVLCNNCLLSARHPMEDLKANPSANPSLNTCLRLERSYKRFPTPQPEAERMIETDIYTLEMATRYFSPHSDTPKSSQSRWVRGIFYEAQTNGQNRRHWQTLSACPWVGHSIRHTYTTRWICWFSMCVMAIWLSVTMVIFDPS